MSLKFIRLKVKNNDIYMCWSDFHTDINNLGKTKFTWFILFQKCKYIDLDSVASQLLVRQNLVMGMGVRGKQEAERENRKVSKIEYRLI